MAPKPHVAYGNLFTIQTDTLMTDRRRRTSTGEFYLPEHLVPQPDPRARGTPYRAAESSHDPSLLPDHAEPRQVGRRGDIPSSPAVANSLRRRSTLVRADEYRQHPSPHPTHQHYQLHHRHQHEHQDEDQPNPQFSTQQFIQMLVLICIGYLVWDANYNVQMASKRLAQYRQETVEADLRASQLYDLLHEMKTEFNRGGRQAPSYRPILGAAHNEELRILEETRVIKQEINKLKKQNVSFGQEVTSLQGFLSQKQ